jgi:hypothetical protein
LLGVVLYLADDVRAHLAAGGGIRLVVAWWSRKGGVAALLGQSVVEDWMHMLNVWDGIFWRYIFFEQGKSDFRCDMDPLQQLCLSAV